MLLIEKPIEFFTYLTNDAKILSKNVNKLLSRDEFVVDDNFLSVTAEKVNGWQIRHKKKRRQIINSAVCNLYIAYRKHALQQRITDFGGD